MKYAVLLLLFCGCSTMPPLNVENLSKQLSEGNSSFSLTVQGRNVSIVRANPMLGIASSAGTNGVSVTPPNGFNLSAVHHQVTMAPPGTAAPQQTNNAPVKP